ARGGGNARVARGDAGGDDHLVMALQAGLGGGSVQPQVDAGVVQLSGEPVDQAAELFLPRDGGGKVQLPAGPGGGFVERDAVPASGGGDGGGHAGRTGADHGDALRGGRGVQPQFGFMAGAGIDQAGGQPAREGMVQAGLVAGDAGRDVGPAPGG